MSSDRPHCRHRRPVRVRPGLRVLAATALWITPWTGPVSGAAVASAQQVDPATINARVHDHVSRATRSDRIQTVSGQMYLASEDIEAAVVGEALARMLDEQRGADASVAIQRGPRLNFEIHFPKNSAELTPESRQSLDALAAALDLDAYRAMRFVLGGHTDQDGDAAVNGPLSQARADVARRYLVDHHGIDAARLVARGFGEQDPLRAVEENPQDKLFNRRVDLRPLR